MTGKSFDTGSAATAHGAVACSLDVQGMDCSSCAETVEKALRRLDGVQDVRVDVVAGRVSVSYAEGTVARGDLAGAITRVGYSVTDAGAAAPEASWWERRGRLVLAATSGVLRALSLITDHLLEACDE